MVTHTLQAVADDAAPDAGLRTLCRLLVPAVADACEVNVIEGDRLRRISVSDLTGDMAPAVAAIRSSYVGRLDDAHPVAEVARRGTIHVASIDDDDADHWFGPPGLPHTARALGLHQVALVPMRGRSGIVGVLSVGVGPSGRTLRPSDLELLQVTGAQAAAALENAVLYDAARRTAVTLQRALLPAGLPASHWFRAVGRYRPASTELEVGGDWYDASLLGDGALAVTIGDVGGHGVEAAAVMGQLRSAIAALHLDHSSPEAVVRRLKRLDVMADAFATVLCATVDRTGTFRWTSAGHPPPVVLRADGRAAFLPGDADPPLGTGEPIRPTVHDEQLADGDVVILFTDGLVECRGEDLEVGFERLLAEVAASDWRDLPRAVDRLLDRLPRGTDDVALLVLALDLGS
jgi:hypothetical protein